MLAGVTSASSALDAGVGVATVQMTTLEGYAIVVRLDEDGVRIQSAIDDQCPYNRTTYDCVNTLLLNNSAGFKTHFNASLFAALAKVADEQERVAEGERETK